jgi:tetratricopeptide (TPR) repeat protein
MAEADLSEFGKSQLPEVASGYYGGALFQLLKEDSEGYKKLCATMVEKFGNKEDPEDLKWNWLCWTCALGPEAVSDYARVLDLAEKRAAKSSKSPLNLNVLGAVLYRSGRFEEAVKRLTQANRLNPDTQPLETLGEQEWQAPSSAYQWFFLAMAHFRLGHTAEAKLWLDKAIERTKRELKVSPGLIFPVPTKAGDDPPPYVHWICKATLRVLRREAEALIDPKGKPQPKEEKPETRNQKPEESKPESKGKEK